MRTLDLLLLLCVGLGGSAAFAELSFCNFVLQFRITIRHDQDTLLSSFKGPLKCDLNGF